MGSGAAYCQLMDLLYPGTVPMRRVKFDPKQEFERIDNFKMLQASFRKLNIEKNVALDRLVKLKFQDNLEFFQWFKKFFDVNCDVDRLESCIPVAGAVSSLAAGKEDDQSINSN